MCALCPQEQTGGQDEGGPGPEVAGSEGWREGAILPWWRVGRCPVSLPAVGPSMSSPLAALNQAVCSAESRTGWCHPVCPKPSSAGSLTHAGIREGGGEAMSAQSPLERAARARFVWAVPFQLYVPGSSIES